MPFSFRSITATFFAVCALIYICLSPSILYGQEHVKILTGHTSCVLSLSFSNDGKWLLSGSEDYSQKLWNIENGKCVKTIKGPLHGIHASAFSPDSRSILTFSKDHKILMTDVENGTTSKTFTGHTAAINGLHFSQDGKYLVSGSVDKTVRIWDVQTGNLIKTLSGHTGAVKSVAISADNKKIISSSWDKTVRIWDKETGKNEKTLPGTSSACNIAIFPDNKHFLSGADDFSFSMRDISTGAPSKTFKGHVNKILSLAVSPEGNYILSGSLDGSMKLWETASGQCIRTFYKKAGGVSSVAFSPHLNYVASGSADIKIWEISLSNKFLIEKLVQQKIAAWQVKGKYESTEMYASRVNEQNLKSKNSTLTKLITDSIGHVKSGKLHIEALEYNSDKGTFDITFVNPETDGIILKVPSEQAKSFEDNKDKIQFNKTKYKLNESDLFELAFCEVINPANGNKYIFNPNHEPIQEPVTSEGNEKKNEPIAVASKTRSTSPINSKRPVISIIQPRVQRGSQYQHTEKKMTVKGNVESEAGLFLLLVNGLETSVSPTGCFESDVILGYNENTVIIKAIDKLNQVSSDTLNVYRPFDNSTAIINSRQGIDYALVIVTDDYTNYKKLANPINDGTTIAKELEDNYGFKTEIVRNPNRNDVYTVLRSYSKRQFSDEDQLFIFIAGHGEFDEIFSEGYIVTKDSRKDDEVKESFISHSNIRTIVNNIPCKHILLAMDVCFGGTFDQFVAGSRGEQELPVAEKEKFIKRKLALTTRKYLTSGGKEYVPDGRPGFHSPFAAKFLTALRTYGGEDKILTFNELFSIVDKATPGPKTGEFGNNQPGSDFLFIAK